MKDAIKTDKLVEILLDAIKEENYFNREKLAPKIRAIIWAFRLDLNSTNYSKPLANNERARLIRANELMNLDCSFWKRQLCEIVGNEKMKEYYEKLEIARATWNSPQPRTDESRLSETS